MIDIKCKFYRAIQQAFRGREYAQLIYVHD